MSNSSNQLDFWDSIFTFSGRSRRSRFWLTAILSSAAYVLVLFAMAFLLGGDESVIQGVAVILYIPMLWVSLTNCSKRLHDLGKSATWVIALFIPLVNLVLAIYIAFFEGQQSDNQYGPSPY